MEGYYSYKVIKEDFYTGEQSGRVRRYDGFKLLEVGGLYVHLGKGFPGAYRVLEEIK